MEMQTNAILKDGSSLRKEGQALIEAAQDYWEEYQKISNRAAVVWLHASNGAFILFTRGEYSQALKETVHRETFGETPMSEDLFFEDSDK
jgi:hypothetical protein